MTQVQDALGHHCRLTGALDGEPRPEIMVQASLWVAGEPASNALGDPLLGTLTVKSHDGVAVFEDLQVCCGVGPTLQVPA